MIKFFGYLICYCIYPFSFLIPRNRNKWAFGSFRGAFNDNAKYYFIYVSEHLKVKNCAWLSINRKTVRLIRSKGMKAYHILSPRGVWFALTSKYWFYNAYSSDIMFCLSGNTIRVNLWHGLSMKRIEFRIQTGPLADRFAKQTLKERFYHPETFQRPDFVLSSTGFFTTDFAESFRIPTERCLEFCYPRNEILCWSDEERLRFVDKYEPIETKELIFKLKSSQFKHIFLYLPTWRDAQRDLFVKDFDLKRMDVVMRACDSLLLLKPHANTFVDERLANGLSNLMLLRSTFDIYPVLPYTDILITDYSSIQFDYMLMEHKGVFQYIYDYEDYKKERDFAYDFEHLEIGKKVYTFDELVAAVSDESLYVPEITRKQFVKKIWGDNPMGACEKLGRFFCINQ